MKISALFALAVPPVAVGLALVQIAPAQARDCDRSASGKISSLNILPELKTRCGSASYLENIEVQTSAEETVIGIPRIRGSSSAPEPSGGSS